MPHPFYRKGVPLFFDTGLSAKHDGRGVVILCALLALLVALYHLCMLKISKSNV